MWGGVQLVGGVRYGGGEGVASGFLELKASVASNAVEIASMVGRYSDLVFAMFYRLWLCFRTSRN